MPSEHRKRSQKPRPVTTAARRRALEQRRSLLRESFPRGAEQSRRHHVRRLLVAAAPMSGLGRRLLALSGERPPPRRDPHLHQHTITRLTSLQRRPHPHRPLEVRTWATGGQGAQGKEIRGIKSDITRQVWRGRRWRRRTYGTQAREEEEAHKKDPAGRPCWRSLRAHLTPVFTHGKSAESAKVGVVKGS